MNPRIAFKQKAISAVTMVPFIAHPWHVFSIPVTSVICALLKPKPLPGFHREA